MNWKENKKWILMTALVLVMVVGTGAYAVKGFHGHMFRGHGKEFVKTRILSRVDYTIQELNLTSDQHAKYAIIRSKMAKGIDAAAERHLSAKETMHAEMSMTKPDINKLAVTIKDSVQAMPESVTMQIDYLLEVYAILNPAQQEQLVAMLKDHMDHDDDDGNCGRGLWRGKNS